MEIPTHRVLGVIPARYASTRFPGKPLVDIDGKTMVQRVYERVRAAELIDEVVVATEDERIIAHVESFGGKACMTGTQHLSGTDRCAEVSALYPDFTIIINIQGDEPFVHPEQIDQVVRPLLHEPDVRIATVARRLLEPELLFDPNAVKVVFGKQRQALYFSRSTIPHLRGIPAEEWMEKGVFYQHLGIYGFHADTLAVLAQLPPGQHELAESLEQLRWLAEGHSIYVADTDQASISIDTPADLERVLRWLAAQEGK